MRTKPYQTRASDLNPAWHVMDAEGKTLGRLSSEIATLLQGKHKPIYVPYLNTGDYVVVINAGKVRVTGRKLYQKMYYRHSGYPGGLKEETLARLLARAPTRALRHAVKGMLPKNIVGRRMLSRLKLYAGDSHPHEAQVRGAEKAEEQRLVAQEAQAEAKPAKATRGAAVAADKGEAKPRTGARRRAAPVQEQAPEVAEAQESGGAEQTPAEQTEEA